MAGVRQRPTHGGKYQGWYFDYTGTRVFFTAPTKTEARRIAEKLEAEHRQIRLGYRPLSKSADEHGERRFEEAKDEYLAWGQAQGGRGGRPWGETHARNRRAHLAWWQERLNLKTLADLGGILPRVEEALRKLRNQKRAGKTLNNYAEALGAFCVWCVQRNYLADDPLRALVFFDDTPRTKRRAMTTEEVVRLLESCVPHHRLLLETAFLSGLRANELRNLTVDCLDLDGSSLRLDSAWTKNRKDGVQPLPRILMEKLKDFGASGEASRLYMRFHSKKGVRRKVPEHPLLYVPSHPARTLDEILEVARSPNTPQKASWIFMPAAWRSSIS